MGRFTAIVLGSAAGGAFPQWNCRCPVCALAWAGDPRVKPRTQTGIAVSANGNRWTLINASPDLPAQIRATPALFPRGDLRGSPIDAVVLTGGEIDQIAGLLSLREHALHAVCHARESRGGRRQRDVRRHDVDVAARDQSGRTLHAGRRYRGKLFMVPGKLPLYLEGDDPELDTETAANVGIELHRGGARMIFVPGAAAMTERMRQRFAQADVVLFDGTLFSDDEMIRTHTGQKPDAEWAICRLKARVVRCTPLTEFRRDGFLFTSTTPIRF